MARRRAQTSTSWTPASSRFEGKWTTDADNSLKPSLLLFFIYFGFRTAFSAMRHGEMSHAARIALSCSCLGFLLAFCHVVFGVETERSATVGAEHNCGRPPCPLRLRICSFSRSVYPVHRDMQNVFCACLDAESQGKSRLRPATQPLPLPWIRASLDRRGSGAKPDPLWPRSSIDNGAWQRNFGPTFLLLPRSLLYTYSAPSSTPHAATPVPLILFSSSHPYA